MAMTINTNVVSINAQRNLNASGASLSTTMQRLSSGLRVNSAKDDAAGLAISERMRAQSTGLAVAARNANDGISLAQTTEGALGKIGDMLQRQRELAVQASNATNSDSDRAALQSELSQLTSEIDRVAKTTSFNGTKVLDGSFTGGVFQVGASAGDNITIKGTTKATADGLGNVKFGSTTSVELDASKIAGFDKGLEKGELSIQVGSKSFDLSAISAASTGQERLGQMVSTINEKTADTGVTAFLSQEASGNYTITLKSDSKEQVQLKGFDESLGAAKAASTWGPAKFEELKAAFTVSDASTATDAGKVLQALTDYKATIADPTGAGADEVTAVDTAIGAVTAAIDGTDSTKFDTGKSAQDVADALTNLYADGDFTTAGQNALQTLKDDFKGTATYGDADAALAVVAELEALAKTAEGYNPDDVNASTGSAGKIITAIGNLTDKLDADETDGFDATDGAAGFAQALAAITTAETSTWAEAGVVTPGADKAANEAALGTALALTKDSSVDEFNAALKGLTDAGWKGLESKDLVAGDDVEAAVAALQKEVDTLGLNIGSAEVTDHKGIASVNISTQSGAWDAIKQIDSAIDQVNKARGDLGALQTRFEKTVENIDIQNENISAAKGRVVDADFATETANLSRAQILQQAGTAMVAQANQLPQSVLSLLR